MKVRNVNKAKFDRLVGGRKLTQELNVPSYFRVRAMDTKPVVGLSFNGRRVFELGGRYYIVDHTFSNHPLANNASLVETPWKETCNSHCYDAMCFEIVLKERLGIELPNTWRDLAGYGLQVNNENRAWDLFEFWELIFANSVEDDFVDYSEDCAALLKLYLGDKDE